MPATGDKPSPSLPMAGGEAAGGDGGGVLCVLTADTEDSSPAACPRCSRSVAIRCAAASMHSAKPSSFSRASRKSVLDSERHTVTSDAARTVAFRGESYSSATSPN